MNMGDVNVYRYRMDHSERGRFIIINNETFLPETGMESRRGTNRDADMLDADFKQMGFTVELHKDQTAHQMLQLMIRGWYNMLMT